ncbi:hypothetical protein PybrP1_004396 [[Pythium] brassicae (nom. inval.)]|nr:hypothetical protein PybrP1_004396 [[Pythium] brassicae (nom. inval.)]
MFDARSSHPDSPVDASMVPNVYAHHRQNHVKTEDSWTRLVASASSHSSRMLPSLSEARTHALTPRSHPLQLVKEPGVVYDCELEPFEYRPGLDGAVDKARSLSSVFSDQDLVDAIMGSLDIESLLTPRDAPSAVGAAAKVLTPLPVSAVTTAFPRMTIAIPTSSLKLPLTRKPGTFLNKDGRWIKGKPCRMDSCDKRAQSNGLCKGHGGGARCSFKGCVKSSQGGGFCRAHGGGKRCLHDGCEKGTQRNGYCYLHGGVRACLVDGCDKKDRGNGKCFSHGGGRKCQSPLCTTTIRRGVFCDAHNSKLAAKKLLQHQLLR